MNPSDELADNPQGNKPAIHATMMPQQNHNEQHEDHPSPARTGEIRLFLLLVFGFLAAVEAVLESLRANWAVAVPTTLVAVLTLVVLRISRRQRFSRLPERYALTVLGAFLLICGFTQWHHPSNLIWLPLYPFAFYFLGGMRSGNWLSSLGILFLAGSYMAYPSLQDMVPVPPAHAIQALFAFGISAVLAHFYERIRIRQQQLLREQAAADYLTGLPNRRGFFQVANTVTEQAKRLSHSFSLILFDLDDFKNVNDRFGHDAGDLLLQEFAQRIQGQVRRGDVLARWGGEEFIILVPQCNLENAADLAEKLRANIADRPFTTAGRITASFGIAESAPQEDIGNIIARADHALYRAKRAGKNRVEADAG